MTPSSILRMLVFHGNYVCISKVYRFSDIQRQIMS